MLAGFCLDVSGFDTPPGSMARALDAFTPEVWDRNYRMVSGRDGEWFWMIVGHNRWVREVWINGEPTALIELGVSDESD